MSPQSRQPTVYMMASSFRGTIYTGVTSQPIQRNYQHKNGLIDGFSKKHKCTLLVWYEFHETMESAILREKQIKAGSRAAKIKLIEQDNFNWHDLSSNLVL